MDYQTDAIYDEMSEEIYDEFSEHYDENWDGEDTWEDFKENALHILYNTYENKHMTEDYHKLVFCLRVIKTDYEEYGGDFIEYDDPQKITQLAYYFVAKRVFNDIEEFDHTYTHDEDEDEDEDEEANEEADKELFALFGELEE